MAFLLPFIRSMPPLKFIFLIFGCLLSLNWASLVNAAADAASPTTIRPPVARVDTLDDTLLCSLTNTHKTKTGSATLYLDGNDMLLPPTRLAPGQTLSLAPSGTLTEGRRGYCEAQIWGSPHWVDVIFEVHPQNMTALLPEDAVVK